MNVSVQEKPTTKPKECNNVIVKTIYIWKTDNNNNNILRIKYHKNWVYLNWSLRSWQFSLKLKIQPSTSKRDTGLFPNAKQQIQTQIQMKEKKLRKKKFTHTNK